MSTYYMTGTALGFEDLRLNETNTSLYPREPIHLLFL